jgi:hypothetical protein
VRPSRSPRGETWTFLGVTDHFPYDDEGSSQLSFYQSLSGSPDTPFYNRMRRDHSQRYCRVWNFQRILLPNDRNYSFGIEWHVCFPFSKYRCRALWSSIHLSLYFRGKNPGSINKCVKTSSEKGCTRGYNVPSGVFLDDGPRRPIENVDAFQADKFDDEHVFDHFPACLFHEVACSACRTT